MRRITRSSCKHQEENRSSTPIPFEDSFSNTTIFEGFSETRSVTSGDVTLTEGVNMSSDEVCLASDTVQPSAGDLIPIISQQLQSQVLSMEERLLSRISTMLESQRQDIPNFPNEMPPRSRESRGGRGRNRDRNSANRENRNPNRQSENRRNGINIPTSGEPAAIQADQNGTGETQPLSSAEIDELFRRVQLTDNDRSDFKRLEMHRWNISFSGDGTGLRVDEFIIRVEHIASTQRYSLGEVARNIYIILKGLAASWFFTWLTRNPDPSWGELKSQLKDNFRTADTDSDIEHTL